MCSSVRRAYQQLVRLQNQAIEDKFKEEQIVRLRRHLQTKAERARA